MKKRTMMGLALSLGLFFYSIYMNYGLIKNGDEIWWFALITQSIFTGLCYSVFRACNQKTLQEQCAEQFPDYKMEKQ